MNQFVIALDSIYQSITQQVLGIDLKYVSAKDLKLDPQRAKDSSSSGIICLRKVLNSLHIHAGDKIIDFGSGKGGALITMSKYPFSKIAGVELSPEIHQICQRNVLKLKINNIDLYCCDAASFKDIDEYNYIYFYNPFHANVMKDVVINIKNSFESKPREITIIYNCPVYHDEFIKNGFYKIKEFPRLNGNVTNIYYYLI